MNSNNTLNYLNESKSLQEKFFRFAQISKISKKEAHETWEGLRYIRKYITSNDVYEIAAGHGLLGSWIAWMGLSNVTLHDIRYKNHEPKAYRYIRKYNPKLIDHIKYESFMIQHDSKIEAKSIVGIHCCGDLTDFALRLAVGKKIPIAIMTCCHGKIITNTEPCSIGMKSDKSVYSIKEMIDLNRAAWLSNQNYDVTFKKIKDGITGDPILLLANPKSTTK